MTSIPPRPSHPSHPSPQPSRPPPEPAPPQGSLLTRFGSAVGAALLASALASGPAAMRVMSGSDTRGIWPALVATMLLPMIVAVLTLRQARLGLRAFSSNESRHRGVSLAVWLGGFFDVLFAFGAILRAKTHHHPLAGVTFALMAGIAALALIPFSLRMGSIAALWEAEHRRIRMGLLYLVLLAVWIGVPKVVIRILPPGGPFSAAVSANLVDVLAFMMAALLASRPELEARRTLAMLGPPVACALFVFGLRFLLTTPAIGTAIEMRAPAYAPVASMLTP